MTAFFFSEIRLQFFRWYNCILFQKCDCILFGNMTAICFQTKNNGPIYTQKVHFSISVHTSDESAKFSQNSTLRWFRKNSNWIQSQMRISFFRLFWHFPFWTLLFLVLFRPSNLFWNSKNVYGPLESYFIVCLHLLTGFKL